MKRISFDDLRAASIENPQLWHDAFAFGKMVDGVAAEVPDDFPVEARVENRFVDQQTGFMPSIKPLPEAQWPLWAKTIAAKRITTDKGVGDTAERVIGPFGQLFKAGFQKMFAKDCGCDARKEKWNELYCYAAAG